MKKMMLLSMFVLLVCLILGGCFNAGNLGNTGSDGNNTVTPGPDTSDSGMGGTGTNDGSGMMPGSTMMPGTTPSQNSQAASGSGSYDWGTQAAAVEARINMFSEIQDSRVVADQGTALVGVRFTSAYQGELTQRIRDMIAGEVMAADNSIQVVAVTADEKDVNEVFALADQQRQGNAQSDLKQKIDQIARNTTTLR